MTRAVPFHDSLYRLAQVGDPTGVQLVRIVEVLQHNRYRAVPIEFTPEGATQPAQERMLTVTNLAEPADEPGQVPAGAETIAVDVEGRWVVFLQQPWETEGSSSVFPAKVTESLGGSAYTVRQQVCTGEGTFANKSGTDPVTAHNLAELSLGPGGAVDDDTIVWVLAIPDNGDPPTTRYFFDHPAYAKYLD